MADVFDDLGKHEESEPGEMSFFDHL